MAGRPVQLNAVKGGINRLRVKGGASPNNLWDGLNCYIDASGAAVSRPGTVEDYILPEGSKGLTAANGELVVFSHQVLEGIPAGVTLEVLPHPTDADQALVEIHFAGPFLGGDDGSYLYVVAEFSNGEVFHYWLESAETWRADATYRLGQLVQPTVPNGMVYRAIRVDDPAPLWTPNAARTIGDVVEPTTADGFRYTVVDVFGDSPRSGAVEPDWNAQDGAQTVEDVDAGTPPSGGTGGTVPPNQPPPDVADRYSNSPWRAIGTITQTQAQ